MSPEEKRVWDKAFDEGENIGRIALFIVPVVAVYMFPRFWSAHFVAGGVLVFGQILLIAWLPDKIGFWMAGRAVAGWRTRR